MPMRPWRLLRNVVLALILFVVIGYVSNWMTLGACERHAGYEVIRWFGLGQVYVVSGPDAAESTRILTGVGFTVLPCLEGRGLAYNHCGRAAQVSRVRFVAPFVADIDVAENHAVPFADGSVGLGGGYGTTLRFVCLFGRAILFKSGCA